jgi:hypothetical protein
MRLKLILNHITHPATFRGPSTVHMFKNSRRVYFRNYGLTFKILVNVLRD